MAVSWPIFKFRKESLYLSTNRRCRLQRTLQNPDFTLPDPYANNLRIDSLCTVDSLCVIGLHVQIPTGILGADETIIIPPLELGG
jgi:hypothetical protein